MTLHEDLTRVIEDARDHSRKNFNVVKESYGQYLARAILASDVIAQVRAETLREARDNVRASSFWADGSDNYADRVRGYLSRAADALREVKAEAWEEGSETGFTHGMTYQAGNNSAMNYRNPYRKEQS